MNNCNQVTKNITKRTKCFMEKKASIISLIALAIIVGVTCCYIVFSGITTKEYNYVQLEVNPRVEFICDKRFDVVSVQPLNQDARIVLSDLDLIGLDVDQASTIFLDECAKTGYIQVNGLNNSTNITVVDGITQALDVHVAGEVYKYYRDNEILSVVTETYEDRNMFDEKVKNKVSCANKLKLLNTIIEKDNTQDFQKLKKLKEADLVELVAEEHKNNPFIPTEEEKETKKQLIENNAETYNTHKKCISNFSKQEFSKLFDKHQKLSGKRYFTNHKQEYINWQNNHTL